MSASSRPCSGDWLGDEKLSLPPSARNCSDSASVGCQLAVNLSLSRCRSASVEGKTAEAANAVLGSVTVVTPVPLFGLSQSDPSRQLPTMLIAPLRFSDKVRRNSARTAVSSVFCRKALTPDTDAVGVKTPRSMDS